MKVPNNLLNGISDKNKGVTVFAIVLMAIAGACGVFWGAISKLTAKDAVTVCPTNNPSGIGEFEPFACITCGKG